MTKVTPVCDKRIETEDKMQSAQLRVGVPMELPPGLFKIYQDLYGNAGVGESPVLHSVTPVDTPVAQAPAPEAPTMDAQRQKLVAIASAINDIMDEGDGSKLTADGEVRTNVLAEELGFDVSAAERDEAMDLV